jgi:hypothetical protein
VSEHGADGSGRASQRRGGQETTRGPGPAPTGSCRPAAGPWRCPGTLLRLRRPGRRRWTRPRPGRAASGGRRGHRGARSGQRDGAGPRAGRCGRRSGRQTRGVARARAPAAGRPPPDRRMPAPASVLARRSSSARQIGMVPVPATSVTIGLTRSSRLGDHGQLCAAGSLADSSMQSRSLRSRRRCRAFRACPGFEMRVPLPEPCVQQTPGCGYGGAPAGGAAAHRAGPDHGRRRRTRRGQQGNPLPMWHSRTEVLLEAPRGIRDHTITIPGAGSLARDLMIFMRETAATLDPPTRRALRTLAQGAAADARTACQVRDQFLTRRRGPGAGTPPAHARRTARRTRLGHCAHTGTQACLHADVLSGRHRYVLFVVCDLAGR